MKRLLLLLLLSLFTTVAFAQNKPIVGGYSEYDTARVISEIRFEKRKNTGDTLYFISTDSKGNVIFYSKNNIRITQSQIIGLPDSLLAKASLAAFNAHATNTANPHSVTKAQVGLGSVPDIDATNPANITQSSSYRFTTDAEKAAWNGKADAAHTHIISNITGLPDSLTNIRTAIPDIPLSDVVYVTVGDAHGPADGDSLYTPRYANGLAVLHEKHISVYVDGAAKLKNNLLNGYEFDINTGKVTFHPALTTGQKIIIEAYPDSLWQENSTAPWSGLKLYVFGTSIEADYYEGAGRGYTQALAENMGATRVQYAVPGSVLNPNLSCATGGVLNWANIPTYNALTDAAIFFNYGVNDGGYNDTVISSLANYLHYVDSFADVCIVRGWPASKIFFGNTTWMNGFNGYASAGCANFKLADSTRMMEIAGINKYVAAQNNFVFIDTYSPMKYEYNRQSLLSDSLHPNEDGHRYAFNIVRNADWQQYHFDSVVNEYMTAAGLTSYWQMGVVNDFVQDLKNAGLWDKTIALYPLINGSLSSAKWNLKDPRDLDAAYRLTQVGTGAFSNGFTNSSGGTHGLNTQISPSTLGGQYTMFASIKTNSDALQCDIGTISGDNYFISRTGNQSWVAINGSGTGTYSNTNSIGRYYVVANSTNSIAYKNGALLGTAARTPPGSPISTKFYIGNGNGFASTRKIGTAGFFQPLTAAEIAKLDVIINRFETALNK